MNSSIVVVDDGLPDSSASALRDELGRHGVCELLPLSVLLARCGVKFDSDRGYLTSVGVAGAGPALGEPPILFNRVVEISETTASRFKNRSSDVVPPNFVYAAFENALAAFPRRYGRPGIGSPAGHALPLNLQWKAVGALGLGLETPAFAFAFGAEEVDMNAFRDPIVKSPFDIYSWKSNVVRVHSFHTFVVEKPAGHPLLAYCIGDRVDAFDLRSGDALTGPLAERLREVVPLLQRRFGAFLGEVLFFVEGSCLTFAAFSHYLKTAAGYRGFRESLAAAVAALPELSASHAGEGGEILA